MNIKPIRIGDRTWYVKDSSTSKHMYPLQQKFRMYYDATIMRKTPCIKSKIDPIDFLKSNETVWDAAGQHPTTNPIALEICPRTKKYRSAYLEWISNWAHNMDFQDTQF